MRTQSYSNPYKLVAVTTTTSHYRQALEQHTKRALDAPDVRQSAVIVPLANLRGEDHLLLAKRAASLASHPGQICFPGGKPSAEDGSLWQTALRETWEELSVPSDKVTLLGELDDVHTITGYVIRPFVALLEDPQAVEPDTAEIEQVFWVPFSALLNPDNYQSQKMTLHWGGDYDMQTFTVCDPPVWGATARILRNLLEVLHGWSDPVPDLP